MSVRIKYGAAAYGTALGAVLIVLGLTALFAAGYVYTNPPVEEVPPQETDVQEFSTSIEHSADVVEPTPLYEPPGTVRNQPVYFLNGTPEFRIEAIADLPEDRAVSASHNLTLFREATFRETTFFEESETIAERTTVVEDGELRSEATVDMRSVAARTAEISETVSGTGSVTVGVRLETGYETSGEHGEPYGGVLTVESEVQLTDRAYWLVGEDLESSRTESRTTEPIVREQSPDLPTVFGALMISVVSIGSGVGIARWSDRVDIGELTTELHRTRYDEWISRGDFPTDAGKQYVYINSLEDLVDIAIDSGKRVIYDPELDTYGVLEGDMVYYHSSDATTIDSWVNFRMDEK